MLYSRYQLEIGYNSNIHTNKYLIDAKLYVIICNCIWNRCKKALKALISTVLVKIPAVVSRQQQQMAERTGFW